MSKLSNNELKRYWFESSRNLGVGVTAFSIEDAEIILSDIVSRHHLDVEITSVIENVNIQELDQGFVIPNMNPPNFRGVWFPMLNENLK